MPSKPAIQAAYNENLESVIVSHTLYQYFLRSPNISIFNIKFLELY